MAEEDKQPEPEKEKKDNEKQRNIIIGVLVGLAVLLVGGFLLFSAAPESVTEPVLNIIKVTEPTPEEASPTPGAATEISGTASITGTAPKDSTISVGMRKRGSESFEPVVENLETIGEVEWSWEQAEEGATYEVAAGLLSGADSLIAQSQIQIVEAPAEDVELVIIFSELPAPPKNSLEVDCKKKDAVSELWQVELTYNIDNPTSSALQYRLGIGTSREGDLVLDAITKPKSPDTAQVYTTDYIVKEGITHFAAYAYAECGSCDEFSQISEWVDFICKAQASPSPEPELQ